MLYHIIAFNKNTGRRFIASNPMSKKEAYTLMSKMTHYSWRELSVEAVG